LKVYIKLIPELVVVWYDLTVIMQKIVPQVRSVS